jgi:hypothetical protein
MVYLWKTHFGRHDSTTVELSRHRQNCWLARAHGWRW